MELTSTQHRLVDLRQSLVGRSPTDNHRNSTDAAAEPEVKTTTTGSGVGDVTWCGGGDAVAAMHGGGGGRRTRGGRCLPATGDSDGELTTASRRRPAGHYIRPSSFSYSTTAASPRRRPAGGHYIRPSSFSHLTAAAAAQTATTTAPSPHDCDSVDRLSEVAQSTSAVAIYYYYSAAKLHPSQTSGKVRRVRSPLHCCCPLLPPPAHSDCRIYRRYTNKLICLTIITSHLRNADRLSYVGYVHCPHQQSPFVIITCPKNFIVVNRLTKFAFTLPMTTITIAN